MKSATRQLQLGLRSSPRWGGRRKGAGRKRGPFPRDPHRRRPALAARFPCHVTLRVRRGLPSLRSGRLVAELRRRLRPACERGRFRLVHYSVQADHLHLIVEASSSRELANGMKAVAARVARGVNRVFARRGAVVADRYHLRILRTPREVRSALAYVLLNVRKHFKQRRGFAPALRLDEASSGRWFDGWRRRPPEGPRAASGPRDVAAPHTWLLAAGWRRHGLVDPAEVPGS
jgi:REP element-mobilizing transposase RayT